MDGQFVDSYDPTIENSKYLRVLDLWQRETAVYRLVTNVARISTLFPAFTKTTRVHGQEYDLKLVDTAGQDEYSIFPTQYTMDIHGYVLVYSITSAKSFEVVQIIYDKLLDVTGKVQ